MDADIAHPGISKRLLALMVDGLLLPVHEIVKQRDMQTYGHSHGNATVWRRPLMIPT